MGLLSILAGVLVALQTFFNYAERAEQHRAAGARYKAMIRELEQIQTEDITSLSGKDELLNVISVRLNALEQEAPVVSERIYAQIEREYSDVKLCKEAIQLTSVHEEASTLAAPPPQRND